MGHAAYCGQLCEHEHPSSLSEIEPLFLSSTVTTPTEIVSLLLLALVPSYNVTEQHGNDEHFPLFLVSSYRRVEHYAFNYLLQVSASASVYIFPFM